MSENNLSSTRIQVCNHREIHGNGAFVLYWMTANRRRHWNFGLQRAVHWASELRKPLVVVEALSCSYRWANDRIHTTLLEGMKDNLQSFEGSGVLYHPFVERFPSQGRGMIRSLAGVSCVVVTDDYPAFEVPEWIRSVASRSPVRVEKVDSAGLLPMRLTDRVFVTAHSFRRFLQAQLRPHLETFPLPDPLANVELPAPPSHPLLNERWPAVPREALSRVASLLAEIPIDHSVAPVRTFCGGHTAARIRLRRFLREGISTYAEMRSQPEAESCSSLSPDLHFGHLASHEVFQSLMAGSAWSPEKLSQKATGARENWWGTDANREAFLDQMVTWREIGFNLCSHAQNYDSYESLPLWARTSLDTHASDPRPTRYTRAQLENGATHDSLWNAAQMQLVEEGRIHNYLRMLWGKKILEWSPSPREALDTMIHLNNKYALDGRDPNSYTGIFWTLGRYDRPWAPQRPIFGTVRYMSSDSAARKLRVKNYIRRYATS